MYLFIGPNLLSGIGQVTKRYCDLVGGEYLTLGDANCWPTLDRYTAGFAFILPIDEHLGVIRKLAERCDKMIYMTVCETEPVSPTYSKLSEFQPLFVPSRFAKEVLDKQFGWDCRILRHWAPWPQEIPRQVPCSGEYTFYTIGNIMDPRKNIQELIQAFKLCQFPNARLVLKATCKQSVKVDVPGVVVINGLLSDDQMERIHQTCHCYVNCSHSEGVGMGAVEAAVRDKPVIIGDYGGLGEYVKTPWVIPCDRGPIGFDDFLFKSDMTWGHPRRGDLMKHMRDCYEKDARHWDHSYTKDLLTRVKPILECNL